MSRIIIQPFKNNYYWITLKKEFSMKCTQHIPSAPRPMRMGVTTSQSLVIGLYFSTVFSPSLR